MNYIYLPVPSIEMVQSANYLADFWRPMTILRNPHLRGWKKGANRRFGGGCLRAVAAGDKLFVVIHQHYGGVAASRHAALRATAEGGWEHDHEDLKEYTGASLAAAMEAEGLPKNFADIYACVCNSALIHPHVTQPFGRALCDALKPKYPNVTVTGFRGFFRPGRVGIYVEMGTDNLVRVDNAKTIKTEHAAIVETFT